MIFLVEFQKHFEQESKQGQMSQFIVSVAQPQCDMGLFV